ncbi:MAG: putative methylamine utilization protein MauG [Candidatus Eremiobacteraeota bacterium]|nr:putative methylamine utilization protein MauG [Candidatus Eremiobacteraeota bacterium]
MKHGSRLLTLAFAAVVTSMLVTALRGQNAEGQVRTQGPVSPCVLPYDIACYLPGGTHQDPDVVRINALIASTETDTLAQIARTAPADRYHQITLLGKAEIFDANLSVNRNLACATCHLAYAGFTGGSSPFNKTFVSQAGSVPITNAGFNSGRTTGSAHPDARISQRKPQSYAYAPFMRPLQYNATTGDLVGGNFWDMRATGNRLGNPAAEQAQGPPLNPLELALPDEGCVVYRLSQSKYASLFKTVWGAQSFDITWPSNVETVCNTPGGVPTQASSSTVYRPGTNPAKLNLSARDRGIAEATFDAFAQSIAAYEASPEVSPFSSKYDYVLAGKARFTASEQRGLTLFNGAAKCMTCHENAITPAAATPFNGVTVRQRGVVIAQQPGPLFTNQTAANIGIPKNRDIPYLYENVPDQYGYVANPQGSKYTDTGVYGFLTSSNNPNPNWAKLAPNFMGKFQVATLRNVDQRPRPNFVKAYMHNGYLKSLKEVVHFYNTRDALPRCAQFSPGEKTTCWPAPEISQNENTTIGNLGLTGRQEDDLVAFLRTLTDGFKP